jgi:hypothetical protein
VQSGTASVTETDRHRHEPLPGIDIENSMKNLNCDWPAFRDVLLTFYRTRRQCSREMVSLIAGGALEEARERAHGIRGGSGYAGAWQYHHEAVCMEKACKPGDIDIARAHMNRFCRCLDEVIGGLAALDPQDPDDPPGTSGAAEPLATGTDAYPDCLSPGIRHRVRPVPASHSPGFAGVCSRGRAADAPC